MYNFSLTERNMQRAKNFTSEEKHNLLDIIFLYRNIIENKETDKVSKLQKEKAWINITQEFNKNKTIIRSPHSLHLCWDNIKKNAKKYFATLKHEYYNTGGGISNVAKDPLLERAQEIIGETVTQGLINPYDSDYINNRDNKENVKDILQDENNKNDPNDVFSYLLDKGEINSWKSWDSNKLKSKLSSPLQENMNITGTSASTEASTKPSMEASIEASTSSSIKMEKIDHGKPMQTLSKAKIELTSVLTANVREKVAYEIELLKATLEKEKLKIELLKLLIADRSQKKKESESDIIIIS